MTDADQEQARLLKNEFMDLCLARKVNALVALAAARCAAECFEEIISEQGGEVFTVATPAAPSPGEPPPQDRGHCPASLDCGHATHWGLKCPVHGCGCIGIPGGLTLDNAEAWSRATGASETEVKKVVAAYSATLQSDHYEGVEMSFGVVGEHREQAERIAGVKSQPVCSECQVPMTYAEGAPEAHVPPHWWCVEHPASYVADNGQFATHEQQQMIDRIAAALRTSVEGESE